MVMGRKVIKISFKELEKLCEMQCTVEECASFFECSVDTVQKRIQEKYGMTFTAYHKEHSSKGRASLRRMQWKSAEKGNATMQIWLGKNTLGQSDKVESTLDIKNRSFDLNFYDNQDGDKVDK